MKSLNQVGVYSVAALGGSLLFSGWAHAQTFGGYTESTFFGVSPSIPTTTYNLGLANATPGNPGLDSGIEIGNPSGAFTPLTNWRFRPGSSNYANIYEMNSAVFAGVAPVAAADVATYLPSQAFSIARLRYGNSEIFFPGTNNYTLPTNLNLNFSNPFGLEQKSFRFDFRLNFTDNNRGPVDDTLTFANQGSRETFTFGSKTYAVELVGFSNTGSAPPSNVNNSTFTLPEGQTVDADLYARIVEVSGPRLFVNPGDRIIFQTRIGAPAISRTLTLANSGEGTTLLSGTISPLARIDPNIARHNTNVFLPAGLRSFGNLVPGASQNLTFTYVATQRAPEGSALGQPLYDQSLAVISPNVGPASALYLDGYAYGPAFGASVQPITTGVTGTGNLDLGRAMTGSNASRVLKVWNGSTDPNRGDLTYLTLRSFQIAGANGPSFSLAPDPTGMKIQVNGAQNGLPGTVNEPGTITFADLTVTGGGGTSRGVRTGTLNFDTDVGADINANGVDYAYNLTATNVDRRTITASTMNFGRVMSTGTTVNSTGTQISSNTPDIYFTNPTILSGAVLSSIAGGGSVNVLAAAGNSNFSFTSTAGLQSTSRGMNINPNNTTGNLTGAVAFLDRTNPTSFTTGVRAEGLTGEGNYALSVPWTATSVAKRVITASSVAFGRVVGGASISGTTSISSNASTHFQTRPIVAGNGATAGGVTVASGTAYTYVDQVGVQLAGTRNVTALLNVVGAQSGSVGLTVTPEGLFGEGTYPLSVGWTAEVLNQRQLTPATVNFGRVMINTSVTGPSAVITSPNVANAFYTNPTLLAAGKTSTSVVPGYTVTVGADSVNRVFNVANGSVSSTRTTSATFGTAGAVSGSIALNVNGENIPGETAYTANVNWQATPLQNRVITAAPVQLGQVFANTPVSGTTSLVTTGADDARTRVRVNAGSYTDGIAGTTIASPVIFNSATTTVSTTVGGTFSTAGLQNGTVVLNAGNGGLTGEGLAGESVQPVSIAYSADVLTRGGASFSNSTSASVLTLNIGSFTLGSGLQSQSFSIFNLPSSAFTADIEFDGISNSTGQTTKLYTNLPGSFTDLAAGTGNTFVATFDTSGTTTGAFTATYTLAFHDDRSVLGNAASNTLALTLVGTLNQGGGPPPTFPGIYIRNPGFEIITAEPNSQTQSPLGDGQRTLGFDSTRISGSNVLKYSPAWRSTDGETDGESGVLRVPRNDSIYQDGYYTDTVSGTGPNSPTNFNTAYIAPIGTEYFEQDILFTNGGAGGTFNADTVYELSFKIGHRLGTLWNPNNAFNINDPATSPVQFLMNGQAFLPFSFQFAVPAAGEFATWKQFYRIDANNPLFGQALKLRVNGFANWTLDFDDFALALPSSESTSEWVNTGSGTWSVGTNWLPQSAPNGVGEEARLWGAIQSNSTVTLTAPATVGKLRFNNATHSYTINGTTPNILRLENGASDALVEVQGGSHTVNAPIEVASDTEFKIAGNTSLTVGDLFTNNVAQTLRKTGAGTLRITGAQDYEAGSTFMAEAGVTRFETNPNGGASLSVSTDAVVNLASTAEFSTVALQANAQLTIELGVNRTLVTSGLNIAGGATPEATIDLNNGFMIVGYQGASPIDVLTAQVKSGRGTDLGGLSAYDGKGIISTDALNRNQAWGFDLYAVGVIDNQQLADLVGAPIAVFGGELVDSATILARLTYSGDANLDGVIDGDDYSLIDAGYSGALPGYSGWLVGDFNYDSVIDGDDYSLIDAAYVLQGGQLSAFTVNTRVSAFGSEYMQQLSSMIPEPSSVLWVFLPMMTRARRRRRV